jgi:hypothetical protein
VSGTVLTLSEEEQLPDPTARARAISVKRLLRTLSSSRRGRRHLVLANAQERASPLFG